MRKNKPVQPPRIAEFLLNIFIRSESRHGALGDFIEIYNEVYKKHGAIVGYVWFWLQTFNSFVPFIIHSVYWGVIMLKSYLLLAMRQITRSKLSSFINIAGLSIGIATVLLILMYVANEMSYENFHKNKNDIVRVELVFGQGESKMRLPAPMEALAPAAEAEIPEVRKGVRFTKDNDPLFSIDEKRIQENEVYFSDPTIFDVFSFIQVEGNLEEALKEPFSVVLTRSIAEKYFGNQKAVGKTLLYNENSVRVTGVIEDLPANTHFRPAVLISYATRESLNLLSTYPWASAGSVYTFLLLNPEADREEVLEKLEALVIKNTGEEIASNFTLKIVGLDDIHTHTACIVDMGPKGNKEMNYVFLSLAGIILLIACFNFVNLTVAKSISRTKEIGVRKTSGALKHNITNQFLLETLLTTMLAAIISLIIFSITYPFLNTFLDNTLVVGEHNFYYLYYFMPLLVLIVGVVSGFYPAFVAAGYNVVDSVKGKISASYKKANMRNGMIVVQFALSALFLFALLTVYKQMSFMKNSDLGFDKNDVILFSNPFRGNDTDEAYNSFVAEMKSNAAVKSVSGLYMAPGVRGKQVMRVTKPQDDNGLSYSLQALPGGYEILNTLGLRLKQGRNFDKNITADETESILINEAAVKYLGLNDPVGSIISIPRSNENVNNRIIGVVEDFHITTMQEEINPLLIYINPALFHRIAVKVLPGRTVGVLGYIEDVWNKMVPDEKFTYDYLENTYNSLYQKEEKTAQLLMVFTVIALFVACMGLFGLVSYMIARRIKEIGIRKTLGASVLSVIAAFSMNYLKMIMFSLLLSLPIAHYLMMQWLSEYAYHVNPGCEIYVYSAIILLTVSLIPVVFQIMKAAKQNPVKAIRYE